MVEAGSASSVVYTKGGNVWRSSPDGQHQKRLTRDGGYSTPSRGCTGTPKRIARGAVDPDFGPAGF